MPTASAEPKHPSRRASARPEDDLHELFTRMCFNAASSNLDDHPRNHAFIAKDHDWKLSPAYDLTPSTPVSLERRDLALSCGDLGRYAHAENLLSQSPRFYLDREAAQAEREKAERHRQAEAAERARRKQLEDLRRRGEAVWRDLESEIERRNASAYDRAAGLLFDLGALAGEQGTGAEFARRLDAVQERHGRKGKFIERLKGLKV